MMLYVVANRPIRQFTSVVTSHEPSKWRINMFVFHKGWNSTTNFVITVKCVALECCSVSLNLFFEYINNRLHTFPDHLIAYSLSCGTLRVTHHVSVPRQMLETHKKHNKLINIEHRSVRFLPSMVVQNYVYVTVISPTLLVYYVCSARCSLSKSWEPWHHLCNTEVYLM